ncbi:MAG TPA: hypothetical protein EYO83_10505 [Gemmatimonadetes bacterium]|jgi:hypothetical protein|nr:hypothetical protein [Gemmatimonadota bacterium]
MFKTGYILSRRADLVWFLGLPFVAVLVALGFQRWLPYVAVASINLWITIPHHYAGWVRSYGMPQVWERFRERMIVGPFLILALTGAGLIWAPITLLLLVTAWDHQHSVMQQHGLSRVYDFKAGAGLPSTGRFDITLHFVLYGFMFVHAPMFRFLWIREMHRMDIPVSVGFVEGLLAASWIVLIVYLVIYAWHIRQTVSSGQPINPIKYAFIGASYFLWYFVAWNTNSILLYAVAHRIMHGVQYIVMVYSFMRRTADRPAATPGFWSLVVGQGKLRWFLVGGVAYAVLFQLLINYPLDEFGFGVVNFAPYPAIPQFNLPALDYEASYGLFSQMMVYAYGMMHYYLDSFIWKVRDKQVQAGL